MLFWYYPWQTFEEGWVQKIPLKKIDDFWKKICFEVRQSLAIKRCNTMPKQDDNLVSWIAMPRTTKYEIQCVCQEIGVWGEMLMNTKFLAIGFGPAWLVLPRLWAKKFSHRVSLGSIWKQGVKMVRFPSGFAHSLDYNSQENQYSNNDNNDGNDISRRIISCPCVMLVRLWHQRSGRGSGNHFRNLRARCYL